jgi:teichuronic acid biosynthesis glycosyltransferase TuaG
MIPKVSVIMPSFNSYRHIEEAIHSVLNQTYQNLELLVIDGGSTDTTIELISKISSNDSRLVYINNTNDNGPAHARQSGIEISKGKYIAFLDADDYWLPEKIERQLKFMQDNNFKFSYTGYRSVDEDGNNLSCPVIMKDSYNLRRGLMYRGIGILTVMVERRILSKDIICSRSHFAEDYLWWLLILNNGCIAHHLNIDSARYRNSKNSRSSNRYDHQLSLWRIYRGTLSINFTKAFFYYAYYLLNTAFNKIRIYFCSKISNSF